MSNQHLLWGDLLCALRHDQAYTQVHSNSGESASTSWWCLYCVANTWHISVLGVFVETGNGRKGDRNRN